MCYAPRPYYNCTNSEDTAISPSCTEVAYDATNASTRRAIWCTALEQLTYSIGNRQPGSGRQDLYQVRRTSEFSQWMTGMAFGNPKADQVPMKLHVTYYE